MMEIVVALIAIFLGVGVILLRGQAGGSPTRQRSRTVSGRKAKANSTHMPYQAVSIMTPKTCCQSAASIEGRKYLVADAPRLPLAACDHENCKCGYLRHSDRREDEQERRGPPGLKSQLYTLESGRERRAARGRRWADYSMA